jgi:hypothetical protein
LGLHAAIAAARSAGSVPAKTPRSNPVENTRFPGSIRHFYRSRIKTAGLLTDVLEIPNFVLELNNIAMTKSKGLLLAVVALSVSATLGMWVYNTMTPVHLGEILLFSGIGLIVLASIYMAYTRLRSERAGLPGEDELSRRIMEKASARGFIAAIWILTAMVMFTVDTQLRPDLVLGIAIVLIGLAWMGLWFYYNWQGVEGE